MIISIIIPIYGRVELLSRCLESVQHQTISPVQIIVVDDGNGVADASVIKNICASYCAVYVCSEKRSGASAARNRGMRFAIGSELFFCDADVELMPDALEKLSAALDSNPTALFAYGDYVLAGRIMRAQQFNPFVLQDHNYISTMSLVRQEADVHFDEKLARFQDWDLWLTIVERGGIGVYIPEILFRVQSNGEISQWAPSWCILHPRWFMWVPAVRAYVNARKILFEKHSIARPVQQ